MAGNYTIDNEKFGAFLIQLRKENGMTQKELAERLYVSDKAVSKWERGLSLPDIALLQPLAEIYDISVTEILSGQRIQADETMTVRDVEPLLAAALTLTAEEQAAQREHRRTWGRRLLLALAAFALEVFFLWRTMAVPLFADEAVMLWLPPLFSVAFGAYFVFFVKEKLPAFYDQHRINFYSDGALRLNVPGVCFNNRNWPHILSAIRTWGCVTTAAWALVFAALWRAVTALAAPVMAVNFITIFLGLLAILGGFFIPICVVGKKYE